MWLLFFLPVHFDIVLLSVHSLLLRLPRLEEHSHQAPQGLCSFNRDAKVAVAKRYITLLSIIPILFIPSIIPDLIATLKLTVIRILLTTDNQGIFLFLTSCKQKLQISCNSESCSICNSILKVNSL